METSHLLAGLNTAQSESVSAPLGSTLVLAGAGSGKTRVLVHRVAWLIDVERASPWSIMAVTFTNKAAREMRGRIEALLGIPIGGMWVGTFHGLCHRFLRAHFREAGLPEAFQVIDSEDQQRLIKRILKQLGIDEARWPARQMQWMINAHKDDARRPDQLGQTGDPGQRTMARVYQEYEEVCRRSGSVDFPELLLRTFETWKKDPELLAHYRQRFQHILVDEFQDTNSIQYQWLRLLAGGRDNLFVVGDDDQSIYGWRGAKVEHLQQFRDDYPKARLIRLEQNYRSTGNILAAANQLISRNSGRLGKSLWTDDAEGDPIRLYSAFNEVDEARFVVERIRQHIESGMSRGEIAILYRTTAQSRQFEEALLDAAIPYRVYGGVRFFERAEIKDALAYLRLMVNPFDDASFERAATTPPKGIGAKTLDQLRSAARAAAGSLWQAVAALGPTSPIGTRGAKALGDFVDWVAECRDRTRDLALADVVELLIRKSGLPQFFEKNKDGRGQDRIENLEELVSAARQYEHEQGDDELGGISGFLAHASLESGEAQGGDPLDSVQLMTMHSAKGLEFPVVFLVGLEEGLFPHSLSRDDPDRLEEERRLCYVGMTRAMRHLYLCHSESRRLHGSESYPFPSRFLREVPAELIEELRTRPQISRPVFRSPDAPSRSVVDSGFRLGQAVVHPKFGDGVVLDAEGQGSNARVQINFNSVGTKWLVLAYANLRPQ